MFLQCPFEKSGGSNANDGPGGFFPRMMDLDLNIGPWFV